MNSEPCIYPCNVMEYQYCENMQCHSNTCHAWMHYHPMPCRRNCTSFGGHFFNLIAELHLIRELKYLKGSSDKIKGTAGGFLCSSQAWGVEDRFQTTPPQGWSKTLAILICAKRASLQKKQNLAREWKSKRWIWWMPLICFSKSDHQSVLHLQSTEYSNIRTKY